MNLELFSFAELLKTSPKLKEMLLRVEHLAKLNREILSLVDPVLVPHCRVSNLRNGVAILIASSPVWGHKLRFSSMELLERLRTNPTWSGITSIQAIVVPPSSNLLEPHPTCLQPTLSSLGASYLQSTAEKIDSPALKNAMLRLSNRHLKGPLGDQGGCRI